MFEKYKSFIDVFRKGSEVANVEKWKTGQITGNMVGGLIIAIVNVAAYMGHPLPFDSDTANAVGAAIVAVSNSLLTAATSKRAGILPAKETGDGTFVIATENSRGVSVTRVQEVGPASESEPTEPVQPVRHAANGDVLAGLDTTYSG